MPVTLGRLSLQPIPDGTAPLDVDAFMETVEGGEGPTCVFRAGTVAEAEALLSEAGFERDDEAGDTNVRGWRHPRLGGFVTEVADGIVHLIVARPSPTPRPR